MSYEIINKDCLEILPTFKDNEFKLVVTSPPYNMQKSNSHGKVVDVGYADNLGEDEYFEFLKKVITECIRVSKYTFFNIQAISGNRKAVYRLIGEFHDSIKEIVIWKKSRYPPAINENVLSHNFEYVIIFGKSEDCLLRAFKDIKFNRNGKQNTCWEGEINDLFYKESFNLEEHHAIFPIWLPRRIIDWFSKEGDKVLDPFAGCGTVGVVCKQKNRDFVGIEIDSSFCDIAKNRLEQNILFNEEQQSLVELERVGEQ